MQLLLQYTHDELIDGILAVLTFPLHYPGEPAPMRYLVPESTLTAIEAESLRLEHGAAAELVKAYRGLVADMQFVRERCKVIFHRAEGDPLVHNVAAGRDDLHAILEENPAIKPEQAAAPAPQPDDVFHSLCLVMDPARYPTLTLETVSAWSPEQRTAADTWARAAIAHATEPEVTVPMEPSNVTALHTPDLGPASPEA